MSVAIKACDWCGVVPELKRVDVDDPQFGQEWWIGCVNSSCPIQPSKGGWRSAIYAIEAWNLRLERGEKLKGAEDVWEIINKWRTERNLLGTRPAVTEDYHALIAAILKRCFSTEGEDKASTRPLTADSEHG